MCLALCMYLIYLHSHKFTVVDTVLDKYVEIFHNCHGYVNKCSHKWSEMYMKQDKGFEKDCKGLVMRNQTGT